MDDAIALGVLLFCFAFLGELAYVQWTRAAIARHAVIAAAYAGLIQAVGMLAVVIVVHSPVMLLPAFVGHVAGSFLAVRHG